MAVVQHGVTSFDVRDPDQAGLLALTNHYCGPLKAEDQIYAVVPDDSPFLRYDRLIEEVKTLSSGCATSFDALLSRMRDSASPLSRNAARPTIKTCWTLLGNLTDQSFRLAGPSMDLMKSLCFQCIG